MKNIKYELVRYLLVGNTLKVNGQILINGDKNVIYTRRKTKRYKNHF
jgi:hypothetical protein